MSRRIRGFISQSTQIDRTVRHLQYSEVFENTVHHVLFRQVLEFLDKVDHVFAHGRAVDPVNTLASLQAGVLGLRRTQETQKQ